MPAVACFFHAAPRAPFPNLLAKRQSASQNASRSRAVRQRLTASEWWAAPQCSGAWQASRPVSGVQRSSAWRASRPRVVGSATTPQRSGAWPASRPAWWTFCFLGVVGSAAAPGGPHGLPGGENSASSDWGGDFQKCHFWNPRESRSATCGQLSSKEFSRILETCSEFQLPVFFCFCFDCFCFCLGCCCCCCWLLLQPLIIS